MAKEGREGRKVADTIKVPVNSRVLQTERAGVMNEVLLMPVILYD